MSVSLLPSLPRHPLLETCLKQPPPCLPPLTPTGTGWRRGAHVPPVRPARAPEASTWCNGSSSQRSAWSRSSRLPACTGTAGHCMGSTESPPPGLLKREGKAQSPGRGGRRGGLCCHPHQAPPEAEARGVSHSPPSVPARRDDGDVARPYSLQREIRAGSFKAESSPLQPVLYLCVLTLF